jgi:hypothetical protein
MNTYYKSLNAKEAAEQLKNQKDVKEAYWDTDLNCMVWVTKDGTFRKEV